MKVKLAYKLFLMFVFTGMGSMILMMGLMRHFSKQELNDFVINWEIDRFGDFANKLGDSYRIHRDWELVKGPPNAFRDMLFPDISEENCASKHNVQQGNQAGDASGYGPGTAGAPKSVEAYYPAIRRRMTLYDANKNVLAGKAASLHEQIMKPIVVDGKTVGWLGLIKRTEGVTTPEEEKYLYRQTVTLFIVGCSVLSLSVLISILLSRSILRPVYQIAQGAHAMASRKFDTRIEVHTSDELGRMADSFNLMAQTLERYEILRKQLISDVSHDLRTPLSILKGEIEAIQDGVREMSGKSLDSLYTEVIHLEKLANDLYELSLVDNGEIPVVREPVDVIKVLTETIRMFEPRFAQQSLSLDYIPGSDRGITLIGDSHRLAQVFSNLLENSLKYTDAPGKLIIRWKLQDSDLHIIFEDTKPGVPDESLDRLFERLYRLDPSRSHKHGGSGLGLAICKGIVKSFEGTIRSDHSPLGGLLVEITLPTHKQTSHEEVPFI